MSYPTLKIGGLYFAKRRLVRVLHQEFYSSMGIFQDRVVCLKENAFSQLVGLIFKFLNDINPSLVKFEAKRLNMKEGDFFPKTSISYWIGKIYLFTNRFGYKVDRKDLQQFNNEQ